MYVKAYSLHTSVRLILNLDKETQMAGKGSAPRPIPDQETFASNWDQVFGQAKKQKKCSNCGQYFETDQASNCHQGECPKAPIH